MKRIIKFEVSVLVDCPKSWSKMQMEVLAKKNIGTTQVVGGGSDGCYSTKTKNIRRLK